MNNMDQDLDDEVMHEILQALDNYFNCARCRMARLDKSQLEDLIRLVEHRLEEHFQRSVKREERRKAEDYNDEMEAALVAEYENDVKKLRNVTHVVHSLLASHEETFFEYFDQVLVQFVKLLGPERPWQDRQCALYAFSYVIEYGGTDCLKFKDCFLAAMVNSITDENCDVRHAAVHGMGMLGQFAGGEVAQVCADAIPMIMKMIEEPDSRSPENVIATECAIGTISRILRYNHSRLNIDELLPHWLSWLPVCVNMHEWPHVYNCFCDFLERGDPQVLGNNYENLPKILAITAGAFDNDAMHLVPCAARRLVMLVRNLLSKNEQSLLQLSEKQQNILRNIFAIN